MSSNTVFGAYGSNPDDGVPDMTSISNIDEAGINKNLHVRYINDRIYTYTGTILVAVNPYRELDIYSQDVISSYNSHKIGELEPHIFALAEAAYTSLKRAEGNQSCVISGESGSGKTETTKFILQYLCSVTSGVSTWVEHQILEANTILEAFGNAKTVRNDNSSRFGRFMQVCFDSKWHIRGCIMQDYLLEQSRITFQSTQERNYHVFYQLVAAAQRDNELAERYQLHGTAQFRYLNQSGCVKLDGVDDAERFDALRLAFSVLQMQSATSEGLFATLAAILWLGNLSFEDVDGGEKSDLSPADSDILQIVTKLLGLLEEDVRLVLLFRQINVRGNITEIPLKPHEARENRHAMAKALYSRAFAWLVNQINTCTNPGQDTGAFLGVLDIFGFENFKKNSFEQLCINYTNEKLHTFFNHYVFTLEQEAYRQEGIKFSHIEFSDNSVCLELIEKPPRCILKLLSEECRMPKGSDETLLSKLHQEFEGHGYYVKGDDRRNWELQFGICHYAGAVTYCIDGFVDKNRDAQQDLFFDFMRRSQNCFVQELAQFQDLLSCMSRTGTIASTTSSRGTSKIKPTVSDAFRQQLQALVELLQASNPWYVRCIKPNASKRADCYDDQLVMDQLKYLGMLDIIRIRRQGFPVHMRFADFLQRYRCLSKRRWKRTQVTDGCKHILSQEDRQQRQWQLGKTMVFLRHCIHEPLEERRGQLMQRSALLIQRIYRGHVRRSEYRRKLAAVVCLQRHYRTKRQRLQFLRMRRAAVVLQSYLRGMYAREVASALREMKAMDEERQRRDKMEEERRKLEEQRKELEDAETQVIRDLEKDESMDMTTNGTIAQDDLNTMAEIAEQLNLKLSAAADPVGSGGGGGTGQLRSPSSVDLDSLFSFLADVQTNRGNVVNEIRDDLDELQETVMAEMSELSLSRTAAEDTDADEADEELRAVSSTPPLPPPEVEGPAVLSSAKDEPSSPDSPLHHPASIPNGTHNGPGQAVEPIYESVMVRRTSGDLPSPSQLPPPVLPAAASEEPPAIPSVPPPAGLPPLVTAAGRERVQRAARRRGLQQHSRSRSPEQLSSAAAAVRTSRQNSRAGSRLSHGDDEEREQRRRQRVEKKLLELQTSSERQQLTSSTSSATPGGREAQDAQPEHFDMIQFAETYFNVHERLPEGAIISTLSRRGKASVPHVPKYEMITYTRAPSIPTSHVHLYDPENVQLACSIFKDIQQYLKGGIKPDVEIKTLQSILQHGIEREELRNEIYVQCIRQATSNPTPESAERVWLILSLCSVSFPPGKILYKYYLSYLRKCQQSAGGRCLQYVRWCLDNCKHTNITCRKNPPSTVEITAMKRLGTIVCRFFFLDGRTKAVDVHPLDTASDAMAKIADRINLWNLDGWALFQASNGTESHVKSHEFLYDVIASWELEQKSQGSPLQSPQLRRQTLPVVSSPSTTNSSSSAAANENRFIFKKRLFRSCKEIPNDPVEVHLLYAQAVHAVVQSDCLPVSEKVALQLAGLQAQVLLGDPKDKYDHYSDVSTLLSQRIAATKRQMDWTPILAHAHHQYGSGKSELVAKIWYLSSVMQYPVWGTTQFPVKYKGYWPYGSNLLMGINSDGILLIKPEDKYVIVEFPYPDVESIILDNTDSFITVNLHRKYDAQRVYVFEARDQQEIGALVASYSPEHAGWIKEVDNISRRVQHITNDDRVRLYHNVIQCRRNLVDAELLKKPSDVGASNFFKNTLRKLNRAKMDRLRQSGMIGDGGAADLYKGFDRGFWAFSRQSLTQSLSRVGDPELEEASLHISQAVLMFSGLISSDQLSENAGDENNVRLVQGIIERSMKSEPLTNEVTLQLIKQTTDHPDPNSRVNRRNWSMLTLLCSTAVPNSLPVRRYLSAHLTKCASDYVTEEGKYARFAEKCMHKTVSSRRRQWPPSRQEVLCTINCRPIHARFHFMDGQFHSVEFDAAATAAEVLLLVKEKIGLRLDAKGYAIYEVLGQSERNLLPDETLADVMSKWERYHAASAGTDRARKQHIFLFKKHLLCEETLDFEDPVEKELLYHQMLHNVRNDKFPLTSMEAVMLTALRAQIELGDHHMSQIDYQQVMAYTLPPRVAGSISVQTVTVHHQSVEGMSPDQAKKAFLNLIQSWPFYRASIFEVVQSFTSNWPKTLWLAVDEAGTHLLDFRSRNVLCTYDYDYIVNYSPAINSLMIITGNSRKQSKIILNTSQAFMIANLINDYMELIRHRVESQRDAAVTGR